MKELLYTVMLLLLAAMATACSPQKNSNPPSAPNAQASAAEQKNASQTEEVKHDPARPPVDCPLRRQGIDPARMKPFEQMEAYINFLEQESRQVWQKPQEVVEAMRLNGNERVLDLGAGSGYFSFPIAQKLTNGRLFAADVEPEMIRHIHHKSLENGVQNIEPLLVDAEKPQIPGNIDIVFICDVMHHVARPQEWLTWPARRSGSRESSGSCPRGRGCILLNSSPGIFPAGPRRRSRSRRKNCRKSH